MTKAESRAISKCEALAEGICYADFQAPEDSPALPIPAQGIPCGSKEGKPILTFQVISIVASPHRPKSDLSSYYILI